MRDFQEALALTDTDAVLDEIIARKKLRNQMVGNLYPQILVDQVGQLVRRYDELGGTRLAEALYQREHS